MLVSSVLFSVVLAHFKLTTPPARGFDDLKELTGPCGGFPLSSRNSFPMTGGVLVIQSYHNQAILSAYVSFSQDPTAQSDFQQLMSNNVTVSSLGPISAPVNFTQFSQAANGVNATIQMIFNGPDGLLYQCGDVTLNSTAAVTTKNGGSSLFTSNSLLAAYLLFPLLFLA